jgi:hypothetical protein
MGLIAMSERDLQRIGRLSKIVEGRMTDIMSNPAIVAKRERALACLR